MAGGGPAAQLLGDFRGNPELRRRVGAADEWSWGETAAQPWDYIRGKQTPLSAAGDDGECVAQAEPVCDSRLGWGTECAARAHSALPGSDRNHTRRDPLSARPMARSLEGSRVRLEGRNAALRARDAIGPAPAPNQ